MSSIVYIAGMPRSGSTLLGRLISAKFNAQFCGELMHMDGLCAPDELCGCGRHLSCCEFWEPAVGLLRSVDGPTLRESIRKYLETGASCRSTKLIDLVREVTQALMGRGRPLVDSSKHPRFARLHLLANKELDLHVLHILRDPSAVIWSVSGRPLRKPEVVGVEVHLRTFPPRAVADRWRRQNAEVQQLRALASTYQTARLEDIAASPDEVIWQLGMTCGLDVSRGDVMDHSLRGNPSRFEPLQVDVTRVRLAEGAGSSTILRIRALARGRYGYPLVRT